MSFIVTILIGLIGAVAGGWIYSELRGTDTEGLDRIELVMAVVVATVLVAIDGSMTRGRRRDRI